MQKARGQAFPLRGIALPLLVSRRFQVLFHSPNRGTFHLSLTVLVHYRSQRSIEPWGVVPPDSHRVPRVPWYLGTRQGRHITFRVRDCYPLWSNFPERSTRRVLCNFPARRQTDHVVPRDPPHATPVRLTRAGFRLFRVRSPLLTESRLLSFPPGTEMVHFPGLASQGLCIQPRDGWA